MQKFFVAYTLHEDGVAQGLYCALYTREYDVSKIFSSHLKATVSNL